MRLIDRAKWIPRAARVGMRLSRQRMGFAVGVNALRKPLISSTYACELLRHMRCSK